MDSIKKIQKAVLTFHNIVNRIEYPYFHSQQGISELLVKIPWAEFMRNFSMGTCAHKFVGSLVISYFGIGDYSECAFRLAIESFRVKCNHLVSTAIKFDSAKPRMEKKYTFIVANVPFSFSFDKTNEVTKSASDVVTREVVLALKKRLRGC